MKPLLLFFLFIAFFLCSCSKKTIVSDSYTIQSLEWSKDDVVKFTFEIKDTLNLHDVFVSITNTNDYDMANLYMFTSIVFPNNTYIRDTVEFMLSDNKGNWTGKGWFSYTNSFRFKQAIRFPVAGEYTFLFEQAMRCKNASCSVKGIQSLGFSVVKR